MRFVILRLLTHSELGMFHEYRRQGKEGSKQRAVNFDGDVVDRVFPAAKDTDRIEMDLRYDTDQGTGQSRQWLKRQDKNWRLEGHCPEDRCFGFVAPGCLFAMQIDAGKAPAVGAWAVFPQDHEVTKSIMADAESAKLAGSAMIALHDEEGQRTLEVLHNARPDLFGGPDKDSLTGKPTLSSKPGMELAPNPARLVQILASVGHDLPSAVADLIDNSISSEATEIAINFGRPDGGHGRWMSIVDNGKGMSVRQLAEAMRIGSDADYESNSLGKYGYGLKGASWSQAKVFTVVTRREGGDAHHLTWDINDMDGWIAKSSRLEQWEEDATALGSHGTAVLWRDMRPPQSAQVAKNLDPYTAETMTLERHLALVFHRFLEGKAAGRSTVHIQINGNPVKPNNPFGHPLASPFDEKSIRIPAATQDGFVRVQPFVLPSEDEMEAYHKAEGPDAARRALELIGLHNKRNESQGLFIYRHDRLIKWGGWHQMWETNDEKTKLARVKVDFDSVLDDTLRINISKQSVQLPQQLQVEIKKLAEAARKRSQAKYRRKDNTPLPASAAKLATSNAVVREPPAPYGGNPAGGASTAATKDVSSGPSAPSAGSPISVKEVNTAKFLWKLTHGIDGSLDLVQASRGCPSLFALLQHVRSDPQALTHLTEFLADLDTVDAQGLLMSRKEA
jgi:hypothetical protein